MTKPIVKANDKSVKNSPYRSRMLKGGVRRMGANTCSLILVFLVSSLSRVLAFTSEYILSGRGRNEHTVVFGVRSSIKKRILSFRDRRKIDPIDEMKGPTSRNDDASFAEQIPSTSPFSSSPSDRRQSFTFQRPDCTAIVLEKRELDVASNESLYSLPPINNRSLTKLELEFRDMLVHFTQYTRRDILSLRDPRMRILFEGVAASAMEPAVYRAFEVLFEDLFPLRAAGRVIYKRLQQLMVDSIRERQEEVELVVSKTSLNPQDVEDTRLAFVSVAARLNGDAYLTLEQLASTGLADTAQHVLGLDSVQELLERIDRNKSGKLLFTDVMIGLQSLAEEMCALEACNPAAVMQDVMHELKEHPPAVNGGLDERRQRFSDRYDEMVSSFVQWEDLVPQGTGRRLDVVRGCFVGAKNVQVINALRIVYVDYSALRVAGDVIFKLVNSVMNGLQQRHG